MHSIVRNNLVILTQKPVYRDLPLGKLEEQVLVENLNFVPLQEGFYSDSQTRFPIAVDYLPAPTFEQGIIFGMPFSQSTAVAAPFACMESINHCEINSFIKASAFKNHSEFIEGNAPYNFVAFSAYFRKFFNFLNRNIRITPLSHFSNLLNDFSSSVLNEVVFLMPQPFKASFCSLVSLISERLQFFPSLKNLSSLNPNIFPEISLLQDFSFRRENRNSEAFAVDINSQNIFSLWQNRFFFGEIGNDLQAGSETVSFALPSFVEKVLISLKVPVLLDGNCDSFFGIHSQINEEIGFSAESLAVPSMNTKFNSNSLDAVCFNSNNSSLNIANDLALEGGFSFAC